MKKSDMKKIDLTISVGVFEVASDLAQKMNLSRNALIRFCLEGLTNPSAAGSCALLFRPKGLTNPHVRKRA